MIRHRSLLPQPAVSGLIAVLWVGLAPQVTIAQALLGCSLGLVIPLVTVRFWPDRPAIGRWSAGIRLAAIVLFDIVVANWQVARLVLGPANRLRSSFVEVPLDLRDPFVATILGSIVSLTPGTVVVELDRERWRLLVHALDVGDTQMMIDRIKHRYELRLRELFRC